MTKPLSSFLRLPVQAVVANFAVQTPSYLREQSQSLLWLKQLHLEAQAAAEGRSLSELTELETQLDRYLAPNGAISWRGSELDDLAVADPQSREIYHNRRPGGADMDARTAVFERVARRSFAEFYPPQSPAPKDLVHVTCTGYSAPSAAQLLVAERNWNSLTRVLHLYHMGCYAALPATRLAASFIALDSPQVDLVHTELCSLHANTLDHSPEQLTMQALFGDGIIKYSLHQPAAAKGAGLAVIGWHEQIVADTAEHMSWKPASWGMRMGLSRHVPFKIAAQIEPFCRGFAESLGISWQQLTDYAVFAVHPGGPKIIEIVAKTLGLGEEQIRHSRAVLRERGNMSSATLPLIWRNILVDESEKRPLILSLAFGPGLSLQASLMERWT